MAKIEGNKLVKVCKYDTVNGTFIIPDNIEHIGNAAFYDCTSLKEITIPDSIISIGNFAFAHCESLEKITIPNNVSSIGDGTFEYCRSLEEIIIPNNMKLNSNWFNGSTNPKCIIYHQDKKYKVEDILLYY